MTVREGVVRQKFDGGKLCIDTGVVRLELGTLDNMVPLTTDATGAVEIDFVGAEGELTVRGVGLRVEAVGDAIYVEQFP